MNSYHEGSLVRVTASFRDEETKAAVDPATVTVTITDPVKGSTPVAKVFGTDVAVVKENTGIYHYDVDTSGKVGTWTVHWTSTGAGQAKEHDQFKTYA